VRTTHLMLRRWSGAPTVGLQATAVSGHPISIVPWNGMLQVGSAEHAQSGDPSLAVPSAEEVGFLLHSAAALFPQVHLTPADIAFSYAGVRPVACSPSEGLRLLGIDSSTCRYVLHNHADEGGLGLLSIFGGTLATASALARKTARTMGLTPRVSVADVATGDMSGIRSTLQQWSQAVNSSTGIPSESTEAIARWHGRHAMCVVQTAMQDAAMRSPIVDGYPQLVAQAGEAVAYEHAFTLADILLRRVPMALDQDWSEDCTVQAASRIAVALNWTEHRMKEEVDAFEEERSRFLHKPRNVKPSSVAA